MTNDLPDALIEKVAFTDLELQALEAYGSDWKYDPYGQFIKSTSLVADNILRLRGWGHLTGCGALNLSREEATEIQDALGSLIAKLPQMVAYIQALDLSGILSDLRFYGDDTNYYKVYEDNIQKTDKGQRARTRLKLLNVTTKEGE